MDKYELTPEHEKQLNPYADLWIDRILNCSPMTEEDKKICRESVAGLYKSAYLEPPPEKRIVFVSSPIMAAFVFSIASAIWDIKDRGRVSLATNDKTMAATMATTRYATMDATRYAARNATMDATWDATWDDTMDATIDATWYAARDATRDATMDATRKAARDATWEATWGATWDATSDATWDATWEAARDATWDATRDATRYAARDATRDATWDATWNDTWDVTRDATRDATWDATSDATWDATRDATWDATRDAINWNVISKSTADEINIIETKNKKIEKWYWHSPAFTQVLKTISKIFGGKIDKNLDYYLKNNRNSYSGGQFWGSSLSFISFFKDIVKLDIDYSKYVRYEKLALHSCVRFEHKKFCVICDRPLFIKQDSENRPHCQTGAYMKWADGTSFYAVHGVRVPGWIVEQSDLITVDEIEKEENAEIRRVMIDKYGISKYLLDSNAKEINRDEFGILYKKEIQDDEPLAMVKVINSSPEQDGSFKEYFLRVPPSIRTAREGIAWTFALETNFYQPLIET